MWLREMDRSDKNKILLRAAGVIILAAFIAIILLFRVDFSSGKEEQVSRDFFAMDTVMNITVFGADDRTANSAIDGCVRLVGELEAELDVHDEGSEIYRLNQNGSGVLYGHAAECFELAYEYSMDPEIPFNAFLYPVTREWGFESESYDTPHDIPSEERLGELLLLTDPNDVRVEKLSDGGIEVTFEKAGMAVDPGGMAKGYACKLLASALKTDGIDSAIINLGGNVAVVGSHKDGSPFKIGIRDPEGGYFEAVEAIDTSVVTSGGYERYITGSDGKKYHHIIDPATGYPADSGLISATVICPDCVMADVLSTALFIMGEERAKEYREKHAGEFELVFK